MLFDSHAHYDDEKFDADRHEILKGVFESGVSRIVNAASDIDSARKSIDLAIKYDGIYASVGVHPHYAEQMNEETLKELEKLASAEKVVAIGEIGLDYYYANSDREKQRYWFARQIDLALRLKLPIIVHNRDANRDTLDIIISQNARDAGGVFHCYSGSVEMLSEVLDNNFYISVGGIVTFKNAKKIIDVVRYVPVERLLVETDCPYLAPEPFRGKRNDSGKLRYIVEKIAEIKETSFADIAERTYANACELFRIPV